MKFIKEYAKSAKRCIIRTDCHGSKLSFFDELWVVAKSDFPELTREEVDVVHYGGKRYKGTFGIEFKFTGTPPNDYVHVEQVELTL